MRGGSSSEAGGQCSRVSKLFTTELGNSLQENLLILAAIFLASALFPSKLIECLIEMLLVVPRLWGTVS